MVEPNFDFKHTKNDMVEFIKANPNQLDTVELKVQKNYTDINVELYPSGDILTNCKVNTT